jgi:hypothetical protein
MNLGRQRLAPAAGAPNGSGIGTGGGADGKTVRSRGNAARDADWRAGAPECLGPPPAAAKSSGDLNPKNAPQSPDQGHKPSHSGRTPDPGNHPLLQTLNPSEQRTVMFYFAGAKVVICLAMQG